VTPHSTIRPFRTTGRPKLPPRAMAGVGARYLGALAVLAIGIDHIEQYSVDNYATVPTIGTLFLLNFIAAVVVSIGLIAPLGRLAHDYADAVRAVFALGGIALAVLSLAGLFVSETAGLFGFVEHGYRMTIVVAIAVECLAVVFLATFLKLNGTGLRRMQGGTSSAHRVIGDNASQTTRARS
jgi:hypothetical protein